MKQEKLKIKKFEYEKILDKKLPDADLFVKESLAKNFIRTNSMIWDFSNVIIQSMVEYQATVIDARHNESVFKEMVLKGYDQSNINKEEVFVEVFKKVIKEFGGIEKVNKKILASNEFLLKITDEALKAGSDAFTTNSMKMIFKYMDHAGLIDLQRKKHTGELTAMQEKRLYILKSLMEGLHRLVSTFPCDYAYLRYSEILARLTKLNGNKGHYLIAGDFFDDFKGVSLKNVTFNDLPSDFCGAVKLPKKITSIEGDYCFDEFVFYCGETVGIEHSLACDLIKAKDREGLSKLPVEKRRTITIAWVDEPPAKPGVCYFQLVQQNLDETVEEAWVSACSSDLEHDPEGTRPLSERSLKGCKSLMINLLAYIKSGKPDIRKHTNEIKRNSLTGEVKSTHYYLTEKEISLVGYNWKKMPNYVQGFWTSKPHLGWRRCGKNWSELRLSYIKGCLKQRRKDAVDDVQDNINDFHTEDP